ncbi:right-handed parallel beta-helix repeat-containing protein [Peribacillus sp. NPDC097675]|uniref:right-handed parallel beta-helix repeat-containing protein n=1 Tax=Peribacillus sp. NPDC097675 TaxID=3390618 RepID=UPI003D056FA3
MNKKVRTSMVILLALCVGLVLFGMANQATSKNELYVSSGGDDKNAGSKKEPLRSIQKAVTLAKPGTTVFVRKGIYNEQVVIRNSGKENAPIIIRAYPKEKAVIDGKGLKVSWDNEGLVSIHNKSYVTIDGLEIKNYKTEKEEVVPIGISVSGSGKGIHILRNHIHHIETHHKNGNAHGIAVYGTKAPQAIKDITISGNKLEEMKLGASETLVLNGNVSNFQVTNNTVRRNDNIGIDIIGFEGVSPVGKFDQARNGLISNNTVYEISSYGNPAYGNQYAAGGIYVDGGKDIVIEKNKVYKNDIGIEAASEHKGKVTSSITIRNNSIYDNRSAGIAIGGYDSRRGSTENSIITDNVLYKNDTKYQDGGQILLQSHTKNNRIEKNIMVAGKSNLLISNPFKQNEGNTIDNNVYYLNRGEKETRWIWKTEEIEGFSAYKKKSLQDKNSIFRKPKFVNESKRDLRIMSK